MSDCELVRRALRVPEYADEGAERVTRLRAHDALHAMQRRIEVMRAALDEIRLHSNHAGKVAAEALREADEL